MQYECRSLGKNKFLLSLTICNPSLSDGGLYRCNAFNPFGDSNANIDLNFESKILNAICNLSFVILLLIKPETKKRKVAKVSRLCQRDSRPPSWSSPKSFLMKRGPSSP